MYYITTNSLEHHGIPGQKWGVRNGPPYPLSRQSGKSKTVYGSKDKKKQTSEEKIKTSREKLKKASKHELSKEVIDQYKNQYKNLSHVKIDKNTNGLLYEKNGKVIAVINTEKKDDGKTWIQGLEVFGENKGTGLSRGLLDVAVKDLGATNLSVRKTNSIAKKLYEDYGFETYDSNDFMDFMKIGKQTEYGSLNVVQDLKIRRANKKERKQNLKLRKEMDLKTKGLKPGDELPEDVKEFKKKIFAKPTVSDIVRYENIFTTNELNDLKNRLAVLNDMDKYKNVDVNRWMKKTDDIFAKIKKTNDWTKTSLDFIENGKKVLALFDEADQAIKKSKNKDGGKK